MWRRRISKALLPIGRKAAGWANLHQRAMIGGMFCLMACGVIWLLATRGKAQGSFDGTAKLLYSGLDTKPQARPVTADILQAWQVYSSLQAITPDSLSPQDSAFLHGIDKQLNHMIHD